LPKVFTYQKLDKLKSRKQTQFLFSKGQAITVFPIRLVYTIEIIDNTTSTTHSSSLLQAGVGAPSNTFKKAVHRNRVKRLLREAYRLEKPSFVNQAALENKKVNLFFLYTDTLVLTQAEIQAKVKEALALLLTKLKKA
jgi:ribonuclease P protein component